MSQPNVGLHQAGRPAWRRVEHLREAVHTGLQALAEAQLSWGSE